jgi:peptidyl-prolyl cis-trans isomerase C
MRRITVLSFVLLIVGCGGGGSPTGRSLPAAAGDPIATIGKSALTVEMVQKRLDEQSPFVRARYTDPAKKKEFLDSQVRFEVLAAEAYARGFVEDAEVQEQLKKIVVQKLTREEFDSRVKLTDVNDADLQKYFEEHKADYQKPEMVRSMLIAVAFGNDKDGARKKADDAHKKVSDKAKLEDRNLFKEVVTQVSTDDASKRGGGDLRYLTGAEVEERYGAASRQWLFSAETINDVSQVMEGKDAWLVFKRTGHRKEIVRTFDQVKNQIKNVVFREKRTKAFEAFVDELKTKHAVKVSAEKLDKVRVNAAMPPAGGLPLDDGHGHGAPGDPHGALPGLDDTGAEEAAGGNKATE